MTAPANDLAAAVVTALWDYLEQRKWGNSSDERLMVTKEGMLGITEQHLAPTLDALAAAQEQSAKYQAHIREKIYVDATPDDGLPARILEAHIDEGGTITEPPQLGEQMNQWRDERNAIIRGAIATLESGRKAEANCAALRLALEETQKFLNDEVCCLVGGEEGPPEPADELSFNACSVMRANSAALQATDAGKPLIDELARLRAEVAQLESTVQTLSAQTTETRTGIMRALQQRAEAAESALRLAWEAGFKLCRSYGDNHIHFGGEQKERHWQRFIAARQKLPEEPKP